MRFWGWGCGGGGEMGWEAARITLRERQRGSREVCGGGGWGGGMCALEEEEAEEEEEEEEEEGCSAAVERSERRLQSLFMGEIRLCCHRCEEPEPEQWLVLDGPPGEGEHLVWLVSCWFPGGYFLTFDIWHAGIQTRPAGVEHGWEGRSALHVQN